MKIVELKNFTCQAHYPYAPLLGNSVETGTKLKGITRAFPITVPESIYTALQREKYIIDPYKGMNSLTAEWVAERWWMYETVFEGSKEKNCELVFDCVDYKCHIYLNRVKIAEHTGASAGFSVDISDYIKKGTNELRVLVENIPEEFGQIGYTNRTSTQRPRFDYKWDWCTRLMNIGIYRPVYLHFYDDAKIDYISFRTLDYKVKRGLIETQVSAKAGLYLVDMEIYQGKERLYYIQKSLYLRDGKNLISEDNVFTHLSLWTLNELGKPATYDLKITVKGEGVCDSKTQLIGLREIRLEHNEGVDYECPPYTFVINGQRVFLKGFNITPLKQLLGSETEADYERLIKAAKKANANLIRVWGGGVIETPIFYELCSKNGIMVWQDMIQSSSGLCSEPCVDDDFLELLGQTVDFTLQYRASYPCTAVICGGNELFSPIREVPVTLENRNIHMIYDRVKAFAPELEFVTSTSSGGFADPDIHNRKNNFDVHGPWLYIGNERHFYHYNNLKAPFFGEFGVNGMSDVKSLSKFLPPKDMGVFTTENNDVWRHHGDWWDSSEWVDEILGNGYKLEDLVVCTQFLQGIALSYAVDSMRRNAPYTSGCMIWQLNEGFPNISSTALIDFYNKPRPVYYMIKQSYDKVVPSFKYDKLLFKKGEIAEFSAFVTLEEEKDCEVYLTVENGKNTAKELLYKGVLPLGTTTLKTDKICISENYVRLTLTVNVDNKEHKKEALLMKQNSDGHANKEAVLPIMQSICGIK